MPAVTARLDVPDAFKPKAAYALRELCHRTGFGLQVVDVETALIHYTAQAVHRTNGIVIPCNPRLYASGTHCCLHRRTWPIWEEVSATGDLDIIGGAYRLLTLLDEQQVSVNERDRRGLFVAPSLPESRRNTINIPVVDFHANILSLEIERILPQLAKAASRKWPNRKRYALTLSHDTDHVHLGALPEMATNAAKAILRRSPNHFSLAVLGLRSLLHPRPNPFFQFGWWRYWESQFAIHSAFYLFVRPPGTPADLNDCKSSVASRACDWKMLRRMANEGWEFGLHASIRSKDYPHSFRIAREWIEQRLGRRIVGLRHHYFAFDWRRPHRSYRQHLEAGFEYDSSMAYRDAPGFRSGTALPHFAFDPERNQAMPLVLLPTNLMDGHLLFKSVDGKRESVEAAVVKGSVVANAVLRQGGVLTFDWHQESAFNQLVYEGFIEVLCNLLPIYVNDDAWIATPAEVCSYWKEKSEALDAAPTVVAPKHVSTRLSA